MPHPKKVTLEKNRSAARRTTPWANCSTFDSAQTCQYSDRCTRRCTRGSARFVGGDNNYDRPTRGEEEMWQQAENERTDVFYVRVLSIEVGRRVHVVLSKIVLFFYYVSVMNTRIYTCMLFCFPPCRTNVGIPFGWKHSQNAALHVIKEDITDVPGLYLVRREHLPKAGYDHSAPAASVRDHTSIIYYSRYR